MSEMDTMERAMLEAQCENAEYEYYKPYRDLRKAVNQLWQEIGIGDILEKITGILEFLRK